MLLLNFQIQLHCRLKFMRMKELHNLSFYKVMRIQKLPTTLIAAFKATLDEIASASILLHLVDITDPYAAEQADSVKAILSELGVSETPKVMALNKMDKLVPDFDMDALKNDLSSIETPTHVISAELGWGIDELLRTLEQTIASDIATASSR